MYNECILYAVGAYIYTYTNAYRCTYEHTVHTHVPTSLLIKL